MLALREFLLARLLRCSRVRANRPALAAIAPFAAAIALLAACLDPLVSDEPGPPSSILPAGSSLPSAHDDPAIEREIRAGDGVDSAVPLTHGFAGGEPIAYWDFGPAPAFAAPHFILVAEAEGGELLPIDHPPIVEAIPGHPDYSPFGAVVEAKITAAYAGELLTSVAAVQEAIRLGLVEAPVRLDYAINRPVVARSVSLQTDEDSAPLPAESPLLWEGRIVNSYNFGRVPLENGADVPAAMRYLIRREGGEPLSEIVRGVDITTDGDRNDTNDVFSSRADQSDYSPLCRTARVAVATGTQAIDSFADETMSAIRAATDLFDPGPVAGTVVGFEVTDELRNCPERRPAGGP